MTCGGCARATCGMLFQSAALWFFLLLSPLLISMAEPQVAYAQDEYGRPFIVVREQGKKTRAQGIQALKNHISVGTHGRLTSGPLVTQHHFSPQAARTVAQIVKTSLGPRGLDKILISPGKRW